MLADLYSTFPQYFSTEAQRVEQNSLSPTMFSLVCPKTHTKSMLCAMIVHNACLCWWTAVATNTEPGFDVFSIHSIQWFFENAHIDKGDWGGGGNGTFDFRLKTVFFHSESHWKKSPWYLTLLMSLFHFLFLFGMEKKYWMVPAFLQQHCSLSSCNFSSSEMLLWWKMCLFVLFQGWIAWPRRCAQRVISDATEVVFPFLIPVINNTLSAPNPASHTVFFYCESSIFSISVIYY